MSPALQCPRWARQTLERPDSPRKLFFFRLNAATVHDATARGSHSIPSVNRDELKVIFLASQQSAQLPDNNLYIYSGYFFLFDSQDRYDDWFRELETLKIKSRRRERKERVRQRCFKKQEIQVTHLPLHRPHPYNEPYLVKSGGRAHASPDRSVKLGLNCRDSSARPSRTR